MTEHATPWINQKWIELAANGPARAHFHTQDVRRILGSCDVRHVASAGSLPTASAHAGEAYWIDGNDVVVVSTGSSWVRLDTGAVVGGEEGEGEE